MSETFWLRAETKKNEFRRAIVPEDAKKLLAAGHEVVVEDWIDSIIPTKDYQAVGCEVAPALSWVNAPKETIVVGLKALPENIDQFIHRHIYFAHVYKEQDGWKEIMQKFADGGGEIYDLEFMTDENGRRTSAFGYWAGYVGAALGALLANLDPQSGALTALEQRQYFRSQEDLIKFIKQSTQGKSGEGIVIGSAGRSGKGAMDCLKELNWSVTGWDKLDTAVGGPFSEILNFDLFVNCVLAMKKMPPFIDRATLTKNEKLKVISDVSCDPDSDCNMVPLYDRATTLGNLYHTVSEGKSSVKLTAIDNLPSILPYESSVDFSSQLINHIVNFDESVIALRNTAKSYQEVLAKL